MRKVLIATPSYDGRLDVWYTNSLVNSIRLGLANEVAFIPVFISFDALVQRARNDSLAIGIENDFDDIIWIDSDIEWDPEWLLKLLNYEEDVVGGTYPRKSLSESYVVKCDPEILKALDKDSTDLIEVEALGTGFLKMSRKAAQYLWDTSEVAESDGKASHMAFEVITKDGKLISEDITACNKLRDGGFKIYLDPTMTCNHSGALKFTGNFQDWVERLKGTSE